MVRTTRPQSWGRTTGLAVLLSVVYLGLSVAPSLRPLFADASSSYAIRAVLDTDAIATPLLLGVGGFLAACLLLHLCIGAAAVGLAWASESAGVSPASQRLGVCFLWYAGLAAGFVLWSAAHFPQSHAAADYGRIAGTRVLGVSLATLWVVGVAAGALAVIAKAGGRPRRRPARRSTVAWLVAVTVAAIATGFVRGEPVVALPAPQDRPHVIILGIDSLRPDVMRQMTESGRMPNLAALLSDSAWFPDTTTPLARTFPAWVSILTGRAPSACSVVCNLTPRDDVALAPTLAGELRSRGYHTVLATDEVRFSNIDESYGFDQLVTPTIGAAEFLIGRISDQPVLNAFVNTRLAHGLFPQVHGNRAVAHAYRPETFVRRLRDSVTFERPTFLAAHLALPHWPYLTASSPAQEVSGHTPDREYHNYLDMLEAADRQLGQLREWLEAEGVLRNALVVVLSDHGEALYRPGDSLLEGVTDPAVASFQVAQFGHGSSVLSAAQFQVLLAFSAHGAARAKVSPGIRSAPAALEDVAPTLYGMLDVDPRDRFDGVSLAPVVAGVPDDGRFADRVRFTETGFNTPRLLAGDLNPDWIAMQAADHYRVNPQSGYLELRHSSIPTVNRMKQRAGIRGHQLLAALPTVAGGFTYVLVDRAGGKARRVDSLDDDPALAPMWAAMVDRFGAGMTPMPAVSPVGGGS